MTSDKKLKHFLTFYIALKGKTKMLTREPRGRF